MYVFDWMCIVQANIMKMADGLFLRCCREVHERYPNIQYREMIVSVALQVHSHPLVWYVWHSLLLMGLLSLESDTGAAVPTA